MDFAVFISLVSVAIAMGALWVAGEALGKIEDQNQIFLQSHIQPLRTEVKKISKKLNTVQQRVGDVDGIEQELQKEFSGHTKMIEEIEQKLTEIRRDLDMIDHSVPDRYRTAEYLKGPKQSSH